MSGLTTTSDPMAGAGLMLAAHPYAPILVLLLVMIGVVAAILVLTHLVGPSGDGPTKGSTYEAGMEPFGEARGRFNVRFYVVAMLFLLFDVEVVFLWPWAVIFHGTAMGGQPIQQGAAMYDKTFLLGTIGFFLILLVLGLVYEWRKGALKWN